MAEGNSTEGMPLQGGGTEAEFAAIDRRNCETIDETEEEEILLSIALVLTVSYRVPKTKKPIHSKSQIDGKTLALLFHVTTAYHPPLPPLPSRAVTADDRPPLLLLVLKLAVCSPCLRPLTLLLLPAFAVQLRQPPRFSPVVSRHSLRRLFDVTAVPCNGIAYSIGANFTPHILIVNAGELLGKVSNTSN
ncbi:hypothetical protein PIB30_067878 [Stylosanthes scabra]|uniref:Uncharacterized protein n=1 Tax=Stylosanthes scabra TaxID=79078 RepID=A0ABU6QNC0_9FABA|nr:hypothetical protein [Stylosanthes scabra]